MCCHFSALEESVERSRLSVLNPASGSSAPWQELQFFPMKGLMLASNCPRNFSSEISAAESGIADVAKVIKSKRRGVSVDLVVIKRLSV